MNKVRHIFIKLTTVALTVAIAAAAAQSQSVSAGQRNSRALPTPDAIDETRLLQDLKYLSSDELEGRSATRPSIAKARDFIERRFRESGLTPVGTSFRQNFAITYNGNNTTSPGVNFIGQIKGRKYSDRYIVVTAHYDHVGVRDGQIYNGADDNASGTAALFAMAAAFNKKRPDYTLIFVAFDAEEVGLQGSRHFVANPPVRKESIVLNINVDMVSRNDKGELYAAGTLHYPQFKPAVERAKKRSRIKLLFGHDTPGTGQDDWTRQGDHAAFHANRIPFIYFGVEDHADYHKPTDDFERIVPAFYVSAVKTIMDVIREIDGEKWGTSVGDGGPPGR